MALVPVHQCHFLFRPPRCPLPGFEFAAVVPSHGLKWRISYNVSVSLTVRETLAPAIRNVRHKTENPLERSVLSIRYDVYQLIGRAGLRSRIRIEVMAIDGPIAMTF